MKRSTTWLLAAGLLAALATDGAGADWFTRVKLKGVEEAAAEDVALHEKGQLSDSLHVGDCYFHLKRWAEGVEVFRRLLGKPDRNYAAAAMVRMAEGLVRLGRAAEARETFRTCLADFPEAFLDVDIPTLCRAWLDELRKVTGEDEGDAGDAKKRAAPARESGGVREEIRLLEEEIEALRRRIAELKKALSEGD
jgi:tetratricopeptide (TPR) repeat protein